LLTPTMGEIYIRSNGELKRLTDTTKDYLLDHMGFLIETPTFYDASTPREILTYFAKLKGYPRSKIHTRVESVVAMVGLQDWIDKKIGTFSKGMKQKIGIIATIVHNPEIVVFDEPTSGLDPQARKEVRDFILKLKELGKTIFISSHLLYEISEIADRVAIINHGEIIACDTIENLELQAKKSVIKLEVLNTSPENTTQILKTIKSIVEPLISKDLANVNLVRYNTDAKCYEIIFDGNAETQTLILKNLIMKDMKITEFSVPKASLLEDLYLSFIKESDSPKTMG
jgi:ABC-2 type transport system ATP-binding protein